MANDSKKAWNICCKVDTIDFKASNWADQGRILSILYTRMLTRRRTRAVLLVLFLRSLGGGAKNNNKKSRSGGTQTTTSSTGFDYDQQLFESEIEFLLRSVAFAESVPHLTLRCSHSL